MKKICLFLLSFSILPLMAEVFSLWPFSGQNEQMTASPDALLHPSELWTEQVNVNGQNLSMRVALISTPLENCLALLRKQYPDAKFAANRQMIVMERKKNEKFRERILLLSLAGVYPVMEFSMILPEHTDVPAAWPKDLPLPPGAKPETVMQFPKRNAVYGMFSSTDSMQSALSAMTSVLTASGWIPVSGENALDKGSGEIFLNEAKTSILILGFSENPDGSGCHGTVYSRSVGRGEFSAQ